MINSDNKQIIVVAIILVVLIAGGYAFATMSDGQQTEPENNTTQEETPVFEDNMSDDEEPTEENSENNTDDSNTNETEDESDANQSPEQKIGTEYVRGDEDELRGIKVTNDSTSTNVDLEVLVGPTTQYIALSEGSTNNSEIISINQDRSNDRFIVSAPQRDGTYTGVYYVWLVDNEGNETVFEISVNQELP